MFETGNRDLPLVTIGIPTYNRFDGYFPRALEAALTQDYPNLEIVVSDNASTDGTEAFMRSLDDPRVKYVRHPSNIGAHANFNACLENATGDYFLLFHDDDMIDPEFISSCVRALGGRTDIGLVRTGVRVIDGDGRVVAKEPLKGEHPTAESVFEAWFARKTPLYLASTLYNTAHLREAGAFHSPRGLYQDVKATVMLMARHGHVEVREPLASFRRHETNRGSTESGIAWAEDSLHLLDVIAKELPGLSKEQLDAGRRYLCEKCYRVASTADGAGARWQAYRQIDRLFGGVVSPVVYESKRIRRGVRSAVRNLIPAKRHAVGRAEAST